MTPLQHISKKVEPIKEKKKTSKVKETTIEVLNPQASAPSKMDDDADNEESDSEESIPVFCLFIVCLFYFVSEEVTRYQRIMPNLYWTNILNYQIMKHLIASCRVIPIL